MRVSGLGFRVEGYDKHPPLMSIPSIYVPPQIMSIPPKIICMSVCTYLCKSSILRVHYLGSGGIITRGGDYLWKLFANPGF